MLEPRLRAQRIERCFDHAEGALLVVRGAERADRRDAVRGELIDLALAHQRDDAEVVIGFALRVA